MKNRYIVNYESVDGTDENRSYNIEICNEEDPCYIVDETDPNNGFLGLYIEDLEKAVKEDPEYRPLDKRRLLKQIEQIKKEQA